MEKKGFTLIELLIVIAIIGILAVAFLPSLLGAPAKGRDAQRMATVQKIENFLVTEMLAGETLPATTDCILGGSNSDIGDLITAGIANFGGVYPADPQDGNKVAIAGKSCEGSYLYVPNPDGNETYSHGLYTHMESGGGNIACTDVGLIDPTVTLSKDEDCYAVLVQ